LARSRAAVARLREESLLLLLAAACLVLAYAFVRVGGVVVEGDLAGIDRSVREFVFRHRSAAAVQFFNAVTMLGTKPVLVVLAMIAGWFMFRRISWIVLIALCAVVSAEFVDFLKGSFEVLRPPTGLLVRKSSSFPSGHTAGSAAIMTLLGYASVRQRVAPAFIIPAGALIVASIGMSRIYLDMHWTSDVLGGLLIGMTLGVSCCAIFELLRRHQPISPKER
jgi:membrane-associated phospholipid phosphatase